MPLFNAWRLFGKSSNASGRGNISRRKRGPAGAAERESQQRAGCGCLIETLEDRLLLSATASPTFVLSGRGFAGITPDTSGGVAPINPSQMRAAYGVSSISFGGTAGTGAGQTIAIVDAYNDPDVISDTNSFSNTFGLQQFNVSGGPTLKVLNESGDTSLPANSTPGGWDMEEALDVEWAHSIAPEANIILFEASSNSYNDLLTAVSTAADYTGVSVVSMSWGGGEFSSETSADPIFLTPSGHQGVTFLASTGDDGSPAGYPALSPNVVAVGGTSLDIDTSGDYLGESAWSDTGGGISSFEAQPSYQVGKVNNTSSTKRTVPDVSMDADPNTGVYVLDSFDGGYFQVGGTSLSTPMWGGLVAIANQGRALDGQSSLNGVTQTLPTLYNLPSSDFHDVTTGSNGTYSATTGYDLVTGLGTPIANLLVPALAGYSSTQPPGVSGPSSASLNENSSLTFSTANSNAISLSDTLAGGNADTLTLSVTDGTLALGSTTGLTFTAGANGSASLSVSGTLANLNAGLSGLVYTPNSGYSGSDSLHISVNDPGDSLTGSSTIGLTVNAPTAPTAAVPAAQSVNENSSLVFSAAHGTAITFADSFAGSADMLTLTAADGTLTLATTSGLSVTGGGNGTSSMAVSGTVANLNAAVNGLVYTPNSGFAGSDALQLSINDPGDGLTGTASVGLTVRQAPSINAPSAVSMKKNVAFTFSGGNAISVTDAAAGGNAEQLTLHASHGTLKLASTSGLSIVSGANKSATITVSGTLANLNRDLNGLVYTPASGYAGTDSITVSVTDRGDGLTSSTDAIAVTVGTAPAIISAKSATFTVGGSGSFTLTTIGFPFPTLNVVGGLPSGVTFNPATGVLSGTPNAGSGGTYHLTFTAWNGFGATASQAFTLKVNQQPTVNVPAAASLNENSPMVFSAGNGNAITLADANAAGTVDRLTLTAANGTLKLGSTAGLHFVSGANKKAAMTVSGTLANLNAALNGMTFTPAAGYVGGASIGLLIENMGNGMTGPASIGLTVNAVTDSTAPASESTASHDGGTAGFAIDWADVAAAVEELYR